MASVPTRTRHGAVLDANVLVPVALCDTLLRLAADHFFRPIWSEEILEETERAMVARLSISPRRSRRRIGQMLSAFPDALVGSVASHPFDLPGPDDEHVLAAAVSSRAQAIVTFNVADFPAEICAGVGIEVIPPDDFLMRQWSLDPERVRSIIYAQVGALRAPVRGLSQVLIGLAAHAPHFTMQVVDSISGDLDEIRRHLEPLTGGDQDSTGNAGD